MYAFFLFFLLKKETSDILKTSFKSFLVKFQEVSNFLRNYLSKEVEQNFMEQNFLLNKRERVKIPSLKQNLIQFTRYKLLYCLWSNKAKTWACCFRKA